MGESLHLVILPRKISARTGPVSLSLPEAAPGTLMMVTTPPTHMGNCTRLAEVSSLLVRGASEPPKSTVPASG